MSFSVENVTKVARLARIAIDDADKEKYVREISGILALVTQLEQVDTKGVEGVASVIEHALPMREDVVSDGNRLDDILANAPFKEYDCFVVPKVIGAD